MTGNCSAAFVAKEPPVSYTGVIERSGVEHPVGQAQPQEPAISYIHLDLAHQLSLGADAEQIANEERLE